LYPKDFEETIPVQLVVDFEEYDKELLTHTVITQIDLNFNNFLNETLPNYRANPIQFTNAFEAATVVLAKVITKSHILLCLTDNNNLYHETLNMFNNLDYMHNVFEDVNTIGISKNKITTEHVIN